MSGAHGAASSAFAAILRSSKAWIQWNGNSQVHRAVIALNEKTVTIYDESVTGHYESMMSMHSPWLHSPNGSCARVD